MKPFNQAASMGVALAVAMLALASGRASAQSDYPNRPVRIVVGFPAGASADIAARVVGNRMTQTLGQQVIVENKPGAGSTLAAEQVARADKDGYTLFMLSTANIANEAINPKLQVNSLRDFTPIAMLNTTAVLLTVHPSTGVKTVKDLIALAKEKPGQINYASTGVGTVPHLSGELLSQRAGIKIQHVPYKGSPEAATDLLAGRVSMMFSPASAVVGQAKEGKLTLLATATGERLGILPQVPTMAQAGMDDFETSIWFGLVAPTGVPRAIVDKLAQSVADAIAQPDVLKAWEPQGILPLKGGPDQFGTYIASEVKRWNAVAESAGLKKN